MTTGPTTSKSAAIELASELLNDIELSRTDVETLLRKAKRLARLAELNELGDFADAELSGYASDNESHIRFMSYAGRWTDYEGRKGYWFPISNIEAELSALELKLSVIRVPDHSENRSSANPNEWIGTGNRWSISPATQALSNINQATSRLIEFRSIRSRVVTTLHYYVSAFHHAAAFGSVVESIFERFRSEVDRLLGDSAKEALEKFPSAWARLAEGDVEAISQGLNTARRIIDAFANSVFPARDGTVEVGGTQLKMGKGNVENRINAYVASQIESKSRRKRIRQGLSNIYDRVSTGVHNDVTPSEARTLMLETYVLLGEILTLGDVPPASNPAASGSESTS